MGITQRAPQHGDIEPTHQAHALAVDDRVLAGAIVGRALAEQRFTLADALGLAVAFGLVRGSQDVMLPTVALFVVSLMLLGVFLAVCGLFVSWMLASSEPAVRGFVIRAVLQRLSRERGVAMAESMAVGDGANDLPMMQAAGLSVAYMAKPKVQAQADVAVEAPGLDRWLALLSWV